MIIRTINESLKLDLKQPSTNWSNDLNLSLFTVSS